MTSFSAVLLAGGKSTRMGRDKALLPMPGSGQLLWQHQLDVLRELEPEEIFWSGPPRRGLPDDVHIVTDEVKEAGPLAGISASFTGLQSELLVVLAIDLPRMTSAFLRELLAKSSPSRGVVAQNGDFFEPLAAVYPKNLSELAADLLHQRRYALQDFVRAGVALGALETFPLVEKERFLFKNLNSSTDLSEL